MLYLQNRKISYAVVLKFWNTFSSSLMPPTRLLGFLLSSHEDASLSLVSFLGPFCSLLTLIGSSSPKFLSNFTSALEMPGAKLWGL